MKDNQNGNNSKEIPNRKDPEKTNPIKDQDLNPGKNNPVNPKKDDN